MTTSWGFHRAQMAYDHATPPYLEDDELDQDAIEQAWEDRQLELAERRADR